MVFVLLKAWPKTTYSMLLHHDMHHMPFVVKTGVWKLCVN